MRRYCKTNVRIYEQCRHIVEGMVFARERSNVTQKCGNLLADLKERGSVSERGEPSKDVISGAKRKAVLSVVQPG